MKPIDWGSMWKPQLNPGEVALRAAIVYACAHVLLRLAGRKTVARWGLPEIVLLFLLTVATRMSIVGNDRSITSAVIALATIAALDRLLNAIVIRSRAAANAAEGQVLQVVRDGVVDRAALRHAHLSEDELLARVRARGRERIEDVKDAFFERSGTVTVTFRDAQG